MHSLLKRIDVFGKPLPTFNMNGDTQVHTMTGGLLTFFITIIILTYGTLKFIHLVDKHNPNVSEVMEKSVFDSSEELNMNDEGFRFAFTVEGYLDNEVKENPAYVKYIVRMMGRKEGVWFERHIPYHKCTDSDWEEFPPASKAHADSWKEIKDDPKRGFYCIDWDDEDSFIVKGNENNVNYARLEFVLVPCNYVHAEFGPTDDYIRDGCIADQAAQQKYLGNLRTMVYHTTERFDINEYNDKAVSRESQLIS